MTKRMLIDATHAEETRVVVLDGNRLEDFDVETAAKKQLKGNIYLAKVVRVEPSLQAAFVEYGGGRHGFLAFGEIHPDYYQIPVADRQRLLKLQAEEALADEEAEDEAAEAKPEPRQDARQDARQAGRGRGRRGRNGQPAAPSGDVQPAVALDAFPGATAYGEVTYGGVEYGAVELAGGGDPYVPSPIVEEIAREAMPDDDGERTLEEVEVSDQVETLGGADGENGYANGDGEGDDDGPAPEELGGENDVFEGNGADEAAARRTARFLRNYRIQEVIRRRQIMLIQVVKEERGTKGAALTTYISLAGRFCVLMPNSPRGGGISRKITSAADRRRLKEITAELAIPQGMGLIVRTAGANRPKPEIRRDCEYLMRLWDDIRELTLKSMAPALIYEEASLIKRAIRDGYSRDIDEVVVDGEPGWRAARDFMRMLMPSHARKVQLWRPDGPGQPLFARNGVEDQLDSMLSPTVQLKSGGYLVINQAEALVAIDVNSGRSTRERGIEETALRTNLEAADEAARQLRLRDLAGLIVIDFIDMESRKHNAMVERRLKDALKNDRARIQIGQISHFGLLEMSRQRLRPSLTETTFITCPHCAGLGLVRGVESAAIHVMRQIEDEGAKARAGHIMVHVAGAVAMFLLNNKRDRLAEIEARYAMRVHFSADDSLVAPHVRIEKLRPPLSEAERALLAPLPVAPLPPVDEAGYDEAEELPDVEAFEPDAPEPAEAGADDDGETDEAPAGSSQEAERRRRRRRRGGRRQDNDDAPPGAEAPEGEAAESDGTAVPAMPGAAEGTEQPELAMPVADALAQDPALQEQPSVNPEELDENGLPKARRRGRRGGRRRRREDGPEEAVDEAAAETPEAIAPAPPAPVAAPDPVPIRPPAPAPVYTGPTPADPFGGRDFDIFDILERAELAEQEQAGRLKPAAVAQAGLEIPPVPANATAPADIEAETAAEWPPVGAPIVAAPPVAVEAPAAVAEPEAVSEPAAPTPAPIVPPPAAAEVALEPAVGPAVKPIVIGADPLPATERKRGWWKR